ncbi:endonuclease/exonuclease/phosphatase family protein [Glutamicibacter ardleyensis]|uniref:endonuclease/exonuclease/phosphatase family protein n=1 Tax=Glutamicibacter ardleyensis TaxID=225894 RepID=UPI003F8DC920
MRKVLAGTVSLGLGALLLLPAAGAIAAPWEAQDPRPAPSQEPSETSLRIATVDTQISREIDGQLATDLLQGDDRQAALAADNITAANADVVVLTGMDANEQAVEVFQDRYLNNPDDARADVEYDYVYLGVGSKGKPSGADLNGDRIVGGPEDAWGQADFEGQGSVVVLSKYQITPDQVTSVSEFKWDQMPESRLDDSGLSGALAASIPVMSSGLWDIPIEYRGKQVHLIAVQTDDNFAGYSFAESRELDQLRVVDDYLNGKKYLRDDQSKKIDGVGNAPYIVAGVLGQQPSSLTARDGLLKQINRPDAISDSGNYLVPNSAWQVLGQGHIGDREPAQAQSVDGPPQLNNPDPALIWTDVQF